MARERTRGNVWDATVEAVRDRGGARGGGFRDEGASMSSMSAVAPATDDDDGASRERESSRTRRERDDDD